MTPEEKQDFANEAEKAVEHELVQNVLEEFAANMKFKLEGLPKYGLYKICHHVAIVARAEALGIDIEDLRLTPQEQAEQQERLLEAIKDKVPAIVVVKEMPRGLQG